jgi:hypothetical protein
MNRKIIKALLLVLVAVELVPTDTLEAGKKAILEDSFESYPIWSFPSEGGWILKFDGKGAEYQKIVCLDSDDKCLQLWGSHEKNYSATAMKNFSSSSDTLSYEVLVRTENSNLVDETVAYVGFYNEEMGNWGTGIARVFFCGDGTIRINHATQKGGILQSYEANKWYRVNVTLFVESGEYSVWIDGELKKEGIREPNAGFVKSFYLVSEHAGARAYFDNVKVYEYPTLEVQISQGNIAVSASDPATAYVTYQNTGNADLDLTLFVYDEGSIESSPRPTLIYEGKRYTTVIGTEIVFGSMHLRGRQSRPINVAFEISPDVVGGNYRMRIGGYQEKTGNTYIGYDETSFTLIVPPIASSTAPQIAPVLSYPSNGATNIPLEPIFSWNSVLGATQYTIQVSATSSFSSYFINQLVSSTSYTCPFSFAENTGYYWRVRAENDCRYSEWSATWGFRTAVCPIPSSPITITPDNIEREGKIEL